MLSQQCWVMLCQHVAFVCTSLNKPCRQYDCLLCITGKALHQRSGALYKGSCKLCEKNNLGAEYHRETRYSAYTRTQEHLKEIKKQDSSNAFAKHLAAVHLENKGNSECYRFQVVNTYAKPLEHPVAEAVAIYRSNADYVMNTKAEFMQPAMERVIIEQN